MARLDIYYDGGLNVELDKSLEEALKPFGFKRWASGIEMSSGERDLSFETKTKRKKKE